MLLAAGHTSLASAACQTADGSTIKRRHGEIAGDGPHGSLGGRAVAAQVGSASLFRSLIRQKILQNARVDS
jgi:hypothetical protein